MSEKLVEKRLFCDYNHLIMKHNFLWILIGSQNLILATELTFELKENDEQCFFEEVNNGDNSNIEFEVCYEFKNLFYDLYHG